MSPVVSVLMTSYNREDYIAEAIESVLASTLTDFELIICDDRSTDRTVDIARHYAARDTRIKLYVNEKNLGQFQNRNRAASHASGKYLKYLDSDDRIYDFGLGYCVEQMEKFPEASIGMSALYDMGVPDSLCWSSEKIIHEHFCVRQYLTIGPSGSIFRREKFMEMKGFDGRFGVASDVYFNIRMAALSPVVLLQREFFFYRIHEGQAQNNEKGYLEFGYLYFKELLEKVNLPLKKEEIAFLHRKMKKRHAVSLTRYLLKTRDWKGVRKILRDTNFTFVDILTGFFK